MKKTAIWILAVLLCLTTAACVPREAEQTEIPADSTSPTEVEETTAEEPTKSIFDYVYPTLPEPDAPTKPGTEYELPPGEKPNNPPVDK